jgi:hypothetical protein
MAGTKDLGDKQQSLTVAGREAFRRLMWGLDKSGFDNVLCALADDEVLWLDDAGTHHDLERLIAKVAETGALERGFDALEVVVSRRIDRLHCLIAIRVLDRVPAGEPEFKAQIVSRMNDLRVQPGESPRDYRDRIVAFMRDESNLERRLHAIADVSRQLARGIERSLGAKIVGESPAEARIVVPGPEQVASFDGLAFGGEIPPPQYSARPRARTAGAYDDPHVRHYFDPYHDLLCWIMTRAILDEGVWRRPDVKLVHPHGVVLATANDPKSLSNLVLDVPADAVVLGEQSIATSFAG